MAQPILKLNAAKTKSGAVTNASAHKSSFGSSFPNAELLSQLADMGYSVKLAGKALVETNNKDLASALDWLELHQHEWIEEDLMDIDVPVDAAPIVVGSAVPSTATAAASLPPLESRINRDSKDAFLERQRLKELEEAKREKLEKQKREAEIRAKIEEEKIKRGAQPSTAAATHVDPEEAKRQFELKRQQKEAEEAKKKRQAEIEEKERIRREMEAEREQRAAKFGTSVSSSAAASKPPAQPELSAAEKSKLEYQREKREEALAMEKLRKQIEEDKAKRAGHIKTAEELANEQRKAKMAQLEVANARRSRLGLPLFESIEAMEAAAGVESHSAGAAQTTPQVTVTENSSSTAEMAAIREARLRNLQSGATPAPVEPQPPAPTAQPAPSSGLDLKELARLRAMREAQLSRGQQQSPSAPAQEQPSQPSIDPSVRQQKEAALQKILQQQKAQSSADASGSAALDASPSKPQQQAIVQFRMPDGRVIPGEFDPNEPFKTIHEYAAAFMPLGTIFNLMIPFPRREFDAADFATPINTLGLVPRAALTVLTLDLRGVALQGTGPVYPTDDDGEMDIDNMDYDQLQNLGHMIGNVRAGLTTAQISRLQSCSFDPEAHQSPICAVCREDFDDKRMVTLLSCSHVFHTSPCITLWLRDHKHCPVCKQDVQVPKPE
eukprot:TRINITY_DN5774_c0_g1_i1.p1 TRINITY_DN5774_c0_g1~~TRINITY_DN5774_c0_g1_i1.p1  ORF type:complete len:667 (-),score=168.32 TRINITY_DN5774_c0_g1_i1:81-2081(-)